MLEAAGLSSSASIEISLPSRSQPVRWTSLGRTIGKYSPGIDRHPSSYSHSPRLSTIVGLTMATGSRVLHLVHEEPLLHADLRGGQAQPAGLVHRLYHVLDQAGQAAVDVGDLGGALGQHGVAEQPDLVRSHNRHGTGSV